MDKKRNFVVCSWSGGVDSTGVVANLLARGYHVHAVTLGIYGGSFNSRESEAREILSAQFHEIALESGGIFTHDQKSAQWIWAFSPDGVEIPRRNKHIIDHLITTEMMPRGIYNLGMGEYIGADTWVVRDHVAGADADVRPLTSYIYQEYGLDYRMFTLADFGESRYKSDRLRIGWNILGEGMYHTTNCLLDAPVACGTCYKCVERHAAFHVAGIEDKSIYALSPREAQPDLFNAYVKQMMGVEITVPFHDTTRSFSMPGK